MRFSLNTAILLTRFAQDCLRDMFDWWLNNDHDTNYERLARGIRDIEKIRLVTQFLQQRSHGEVVCGEQTELFIISLTFHLLFCSTWHENSRTFCHFSVFV